MTRRPTGHYPPRLVRTAPAAAVQAPELDELEAPETCIGEEAIAKAIKISVTDLQAIMRRLRGRPTRPPIRKSGGMLIAERAKIVAWWRQRVTAQQHAR